ncbi:MAG: SCO family protein [Acidobacteriota bacterium]
MHDDSMSPLDLARRRLRRVAVIGWLLAMAAAVLVFVWQRDRLASAERALPILAEVPEFTLIDQRGTSIDRQALRGRPWVADFIFTRCPGICPTLTRRMVDLAADLPADRVRLVSVSVDPEHDTPDVLRAYAERHDAGENWHFLTGPTATIYPLIRDGFLLSVDPAPPTPEGVEVIEPIVHSNRFVLVDAVGQIRGYYNAFDSADLERLRNDAALLLR